MPPERTVSSRRIYEGRIASLRLDTVELPGGRTALREIVEHPHAAAIVPLDGQGNVVMVRQFRKAAEETLLEIPAGLLDPGEEPEAAACRELREETGLEARSLERLAGFYVSPGFCTEVIHVYLGTDLAPNPLPAEADEALEVVRVPLTEVPGLIASGQIKDSKSLVGLCLLLLRQRTGC